MKFKLIKKLSLGERGEDIIITKCCLSMHTLHFGFAKKGNNFKNASEIIHKGKHNNER